MAFYRALKQPPASLFLIGLVTGALIVYSAGYRHGAPTRAEGSAAVASFDNAVDQLRCFAASDCWRNHLCPNGLKPTAITADTLSHESRQLCVDMLPKSTAQHRKCLVYSFGIHTSWAFESALSKDHGCEVHAFDPTANLPSTLPGSHGVRFHKFGLLSKTEQDGTNSEQYSAIDPSLLLTLEQLQFKLGHHGRAIDVLLLDCEGCEWGTTEQLACAVSPTVTVHQLLVEFHFSVQLGLPSKDSVVRAARGLGCLDAQRWVQTSRLRAWCNKMDYEHVPGLLRALPHSGYLNFVTFRQLAPDELDRTRLWERYEQAARVLHHYKQKHKKVDPELLKIEQTTKDDLQRLVGHVL